MLCNTIVRREICCVTITIWCSTDMVMSKRCTMCKEETTLLLYVGRFVSAKVAAYVVLHNEHHRTWSCAPDLLHLSCLAPWRATLKHNQEAEQLAASRCIGCGSKHAMESAAFYYKMQVWVDMLVPRSESLLL